MKNFLLSLLALFVVVMGTTPLLASAQSGYFPPGQTGSTPQAQPTGVTPPANNTSFTLVDPLGVKNFCELAKALLNVVLAIGVPVAILFLVWSGFKFILARGRPGELETARRNFYFVIIGIAVFLGAWTLATVISATIKTLDTSGSVQFCGR